jgi:hypothetical protein
MYHATSTVFNISIDKAGKCFQELMEGQILATGNICNNANVLSRSVLSVEVLKTNHKSKHKVYMQPLKK